MTGEFTTDQLEIRAMARDFAAGEIRPHAMEWDAARQFDPGVFEKLAELGFMGMRVPEEYGGLGFDAGTYLLALEELAWGDAAVALSVAIHNGPVTALLLANGTDEQRERYLPAMAAGDLLTAFALSEKDAGSDAGGLGCEAVRDADGWVLSGEKRWVTNGARAGLVLVFARTNRSAERGYGIGAFIVDPSAGGYRVTRRETTMGLCASETVSVQLDGVRVEADGVVGDPEQGFRYAMEAIDVGRLGIGAQAVGIAQAAFEHSVAYALERKQFGRPIAEFGAIQDKIADMATRIGGARALVHAGAAAMDSGSRGTGSDSRAAGAASAKLQASETAFWVADEAVQIFGGYGYMRDYPVEKLLRDAKGTEIYEGTSEILRFVIAREILNEAATGHDN